MVNQQQNKIIQNEYLVETEKQLIHQKLDLLLKVGCYLMDSSADTTMVVRNMNRVEAYLGLNRKHLHVYINYNVIMVNYRDHDISYSKFRKCYKHAIDMAAISRISRLTWAAIRYNYSLEKYEEELESCISKPRYYNHWQVAIGAGFACGGFCIQFGCDWPAFFYASIAAILGFRFKMYLASKGANTYIGICVASFLSTLIAWLSSFISLSPDISSVVPSFMLTQTPWHPLLACALFIVPGVPLINFVSDMLSGHIQTGWTRALNTLLMVVAMVFGISFAIKICGIDNFVHDLSMTPHHTYVEFAIAAAISAMGFSTIFNIPRRLLPIIALGGIIAVCTRNFVNLGPSNGNIGLDQGIIIGSLVGSSLISLICTVAMHWVHTPHQCLSIPSVIPMVPGVLMYRALFAFVGMQGELGEVTFGVHNFMRASLVIMVIAIGVAIPNIFVHNITQSKRKLRLYKLLLQRRHMYSNCNDIYIE